MAAHGNGFVTGICSAHPLCEQCQKKGRINLPRKYTILRFVARRHRPCGRNNLMALVLQCHSEITAAGGRGEARELTASGGSKCPAHWVAGMRYRVASRFQVGAQPHQFLRKEVALWQPQLNYTMARARKKLADKMSRAIRARKNRSWSFRYGQPQRGRPCRRPAVSGGPAEKRQGASGR